jgi:hypothetical protein
MGTTCRLAQAELRLPVESVVVRIHDAGWSVSLLYGELLCVDGSIEHVRINWLLALKHETQLCIDRPAVSRRAEFPIVSGGQEYTMVTVTTPTGWQVFDRAPLALFVQCLLDDGYARVAGRQDKLRSGTIDQEQSESRMRGSEGFNLLGKGNQADLVGSAVSQFAKLLWHVFGWAVASWSVFIRPAACITISTQHELDIHGFQLGSERRTRGSQCNQDTA